ncbi:oligosaccharide flippase family protein [Marinigracilibium pacificum]|uniref:Oligosaccharide flippase family protein n=1 Tax=Marinigracilibium pacificum TaxID=2729599 RepID=A0A848IZU7_9BACT|nr:oligosaccharide flippase family protein [Marinigracilibium pacificum]NMM48805.1 oligosaccharide flippase family protein [Marinigracilibium pacificum]
MVKFANQFFNLISKLKSSQFFRQIFVTLLGNGLGFAIGFLLTPVISRLYPPEAYGLFSIINSIVAVLVMLSTLNYTNAIVLPKSNHKFYRLIQISFFLVLITSVLLVLILLLFEDFFAENIELPVSDVWLYMIPVLVFLSGVFQILNSWSIKNGEFKSISKSKFVGILSGKSVAILIGFIKPFNYVGILIGELIGKFFFISLLLNKRVIRRTKFILTNLNLSKIKEVAVEYKRYPLFALPANWLQALILQIPVYFLSHYFDLESVGYYSMANGLLIIPLNVLGNSVASVFMKRAVDLQYVKERLARETENLYFKLLYVVIVPFAVLFIYGENIFTILLGDQWGTSGELASIMTVYFVFQTCAIPISLIYMVKQKEKQFLYFQIVSVLIVLTSLFLSLDFSSLMISMKFYAGANVLVYLIGIYMTFSFVGKSNKSILFIIGKSILVISMAFSIVWGISYLFNL